MAAHMAIEMSSVASNRSEIGTAKIKTINDRVAATISLNINADLIYFSLLVIFPLEVANSYEYHLAWEIDVYSEESYKSERYFIDALTGDIIYEEDLYISSTFRI